MSQANSEKPSKELKDKTGIFTSIVKNRGFFEDLFLYLTLILVIAFSSWFLSESHENTQDRLQPKTEANIFLDEIKRIEASDKNAADKNYLAYLQAQSNLNKKRYDLASQTLIANLTRKNIGFLIGTILSLIGCIVIVRRIRNMSLEAEGNVSEAKLKFLSASPGVLLVFFGSIIVTATILRTDEINVKDYEPVSPFNKSVNINYDDKTQKAMLDELKRVEEENRKAQENQSSNAATEGNKK